MIRQLLLAGSLSLALLQATTGAPRPGGAADAAIPATPPATTTTVQDVKPPLTSNKWRIQFDESSKSDGTITFRVWTSAATTVDVPVAVRDNQTENSIARSTRNAFRNVLGAGYKVETDDGEDVLIKTKGKTPNFGLALVSSTAKDVDIDLDRE